MGTVVFPGADVKFFLDADGESRARRRHRELLESNAAVTLEEVREAMKKRDEADSSRQVAPLKPAPDAVTIDSTALTVDQVVGTMLDHITKSEK